MDVQSGESEEEEVTQQRADTVSNCCEITSRPVRDIKCFAFCQI